MRFCAVDLPTFFPTRRGEPPQGPSNETAIIEATNGPNFYGFYSPDLEGFTGVGHSVEDCLYKAKRGMEGHIETLKEQHLPVPKENPDPRIIIRSQESSAKTA